MTLIHFQYISSYHQPATGGVVFMPHRKHAANETVVLPKPFTRPLVDGVVEVDLEPTSDDWLWSVTHDHDTRFYAIPDTDGVINHTDLIPVAPSTLTHRIEPVWWAELRQHQQLIADYVNESRSSVREAIETVHTVHDTLETAVSDAQRHESVAGAYSRQAQTSNEQAWEAAKGPDGAAQRAKDEADRAKIYRDESNTNRVESQTAQRSSEAARDESRSARDESVTAQHASETARDESQSARDESVTAQRASETARDEATTGPNNAADRAEVAATTATAQADIATTAADEATQSTDTANTHQVAANTAADRAETAAEQAETAAATFTIGPWQEVTLINGWTEHSASFPLQYRTTPLGIQIVGRINAESATSNNAFDLQLTNRIKTATVQASPRDDQPPANLILSSTGSGVIAGSSNYTSLDINTLIPFT